MASISDKITKTMDGQNPNTTTVSTERAQGATELRARNLDGWPEDTAVHFTTYRTDSQGDIIDGSETDWKGIVSRNANIIANLTRTGGAPDQGNSADDVIEPMPTAAWGNDLAEALLKNHNADGTLQNNIIGAENIKSGAVTGEKIADGAVDADKMSLSSTVLLDYNTSDNDKPVNQTFNAPKACKVKITVSFTGLVKSNANVVARMRVFLDETQIMTFTNATFSGDSEFGMRRSPLGTMVKTADVTAGDHTLTFAENGGWEINDGAGVQVLVERLS